MVCGMIVDLAVHEGKSDNEEEPDNPHFHVLAPIRPFTEEGIWGNKQRREYILDEDGNRVKDAKGKDMFNAVSTTGWNDPELLKEWRRAWTEKVNGKFQECHMAARIDHRSYKEQGIDLIPTIHEGYEVRAMEKKGIKTVIGELNRAIRQFNQMFISLKESIQWMKTAYEEMKDELDRRQNPTLLESLQDYYDKKTQGRPLLPNFYAEMKRRGKNLSNLQEFAKSINYLQTYKIETMEDIEPFNVIYKTAEDGMGDTIFQVSGVSKGRLTDNIEKRIIIRGGISHTNACVGGVDNGSNKRLCCPSG